MNNGYLATPAQVANVVLTLAFGKYEEYKLTPYKLGKLVYMIYAWYYAIYNKPLFQDSITIGVNGPVVDDIDNQFAIYKNNIVTSLASTYNVDTGSDVGNLSANNFEHKKVIDIANTVLSFYKDLGDTEIRKLTHEEGSVWSIETGNGAKLQDKLGQPIADIATIKKRAEKAIERYKKYRGYV
jgi:uncharacterized phage-associated protein